MTPRWHGALLCAAAGLLLGACADGYPDKAEAIPLRYGMGQPDAMKAMNQIAQNRPPKQSKRFALQEGCALEIHARRPVDGRESRTLPLRRTKASMEKIPGGNTYRVTLNPPGAEDTAETVIEGILWTEATQMKWLLEYVQSTC